MTELDRIAIMDSDVTSLKDLVGKDLQWLCVEERVISQEDWDKLMTSINAKVREQRAFVIELLFSEDLPDDFDDDWDDSPYPDEFEGEDYDDDLDDDPFRVDPEIFTKPLKDDNKLTDVGHGICKLVSSLCTAADQHVVVNYGYYGLQAIDDSVLAKRHPSDSAAWMWQKDGRYCEDQDDEHRYFLEPHEERLYVIEDSLTPSHLEVSGLPKQFGHSAQLQKEVSNLMLIRMFDECSWQRSWKYQRKAARQHKGWTSGDRFTDRRPDIDFWSEN